MTQPPIRDYGLIGDMHSCALVSRAGSIDWACLPRFDSASVFGRLLDWRQGGFYLLAPNEGGRVSRRYVPGTNVLETTFETSSGRAVLIDFMPVTSRVEHPTPRELLARRQIVRSMRCDRGTVPFQMICSPRFDYGSIVPHLTLHDPSVGSTHGGKDAISVYCSADMDIEGDCFRSEGLLREGDEVWTAVTYEEMLGHVERLDEDQLRQRLAETNAFWEDWSGQCVYDGEYSDDVRRAALTLKALTYSPTGALLAAPTTSLPESLGGVRNWDYRFTWIRDATFALYSLFILGYRHEADDFKHWMEWSTLGRASDLQVMYGIRGERRLTEVELSHLEGYRNSKPVRIGNGAFSQFQLDIYGEVMDSAHLYRRFGGVVEEEYWDFLRQVVEFVCDHWREPDDGIWEARSDRQHHVFSKAMCWVALDRGIRAASELAVPGDVRRWKAVRQEIREEILEKGFDAELGSFVQHYGSKTLDASALLLPLVGFMPAGDPRMKSTIDAIQEKLTTEDGLVYRYRGFDDGLEGEEGAFLICSFWLVDNLIFTGQMDRARQLFEKLRTYSNDLDLYSEEIDPKSLELLGNFPQAFTHLGLISSAVQLGSSPRMPTYAE